MSGRRPDRSRAGEQHAVPGFQPVREALLAGRHLDEILLAAPQRSTDITAAAEAAGVPVREASRDELDERAHGVVHNGVVAIAPPFRYVGLPDIFDARFVVVLDGVTDPQNLGAVARSAEAVGAGGLVLPQRRSAHVTPAAEKASAGAFSWLPVAVVPNLVRALADLAERGFWSVGLDGTADETIWTSPLLDGRTALVVGAEGAGLSRLVRERCDGLAAIPMVGRIDSLNASAAASVAMFEWARRGRAAD